MTEKELMTQIIRVATKLGYLHYHTHDSRRSDFGFPDLVLIKHGRLIWIECKSETGKVAPEQEQWHDLLAMNYQEIYVVYPKHLDELLEILTLGHKPTKAESMNYDSAVVANYY